MNSKTNNTATKSTQKPDGKTNKQGDLQEVINNGNQKLPSSNNLDRENNNDSSTDDERQRRRR
jgi:hypothetical protein